jgi:hypothetical protein
MYDDGDYGGIDEFMYWVTIAILLLITIALLGAAAGLMYWALK